MRTCNQAGRDLIRKYEGSSLFAYQDPRGVWTIGVGHTEGVKQGDVITTEEEEDLLTHDLRSAEEGVEHTIVAPLTDNQFAALCSFVFNVGVGNFQGSTLRKRLNNREYQRVPVELKKWNHVGGVVSEGLTNRRDAEISLWETKE